MINSNNVTTARENNSYLNENFTTIASMNEEEDFHLGPMF